ncbi:Protein of unknown function DUF2865 [Rhabdaerophilaceae bacterium]
MAFRRENNSTQSVVEGLSPVARRSTMASIVLGSIIMLGTGVVLVKAADNPSIREVFIEFNKPVRRAVDTYVSRVPNVQLPQVFRRMEGQRSHANAPERVPRFVPTGRDDDATRASGLPAAPSQLQSVVDAGQPRTPRPLKVPKPSQTFSGNEPGLSTATNYCVRLCDGFAFPIGRSGFGEEGEHEAACRLACPNSEVALYSMPRGAKDLTEATRGGTPYSALPTAFRYRDEYSKTCSCRAPGQTQSAAALLSDFTLRRGDLAMTRIGMRHFDGSRRFPLQENSFSDALRHIKDPAEARRVRGMEAASLRGNLPVEAHTSVRNRIADEIRQAEARVASEQAQPRRITEVPAGPRRFKELSGPASSSPVAAAPRESRQRIVALN